MYKVKSLDEFINESFFKNLNVGEYARIEAQLVEWSKQKVNSYPRIEPGSWTINNDLTVDINGNVWLADLDFEKLTVKFGKVTGYFSVYNCKNLSSLEGCPVKVGTTFNCSFCDKLKTTKYCPADIGIGFHCSSCANLITLEGLQKSIIRFFIDNCKKLKSLKGSPRVVKEIFSANFCSSLKNLIGSPDTISNEFSATGCSSLVSLDGAPRKVENNFNVTNCNNLVDISGGPEEVGSYLIAGSGKQFTDEEIKKYTKVKKYTYTKKLI